jgi:hypothetical protein
MSQNAPRHPHPALAAALGAAVAAAALLTAQQATRQPHVIGGYRQSFVVRESGAYAGSGAPPQVSLPGRKSSDICVFVKADNATFRGISTLAGFRGWQMNDRSNLRFEQCSARNAGTIGGRDGNDWFTVNSHGLTLTGCAGLDSAGSHSLYLSNYNGGTTQDVTCTGCTFTGNTAAAVLQINTASGGPTRNVHFIDTQVSSQRQGAILNLLGCGSAADPVTFTRCTFTSPNSSPRAVTVSNFDAKRATVVVFDGCKLKGGLFVEGGSRVVLKGGTVVSGKVTTASGGTVLKQ